MSSSAIFSALIGSVLFIALPTAIAWWLIGKKTPTTANNHHLWWGYLAGLVLFIGWLSWAPDWGLGQLIHHGPPTHFAGAQIIGLALSLGASTVALTLRRVRTLGDGLRLGLLHGAGAATAMSLSNLWITSPSQEGVGVGLALIGVAAATSLLSGATWALVRATTRRG